MAEKLADHWQAERAPGADAGEAMTQIVNAQPFQPGGARHRRPWLFQVDPRPRPPWLRNDDMRVAVEAGRSRARPCAARRDRSASGRSSSARNSTPRSSSSCDHWASRISRSRAPVRASNRIAATANGSSFTSRFSALGACLRSASSRHIGQANRFGLAQSVAEPGEFVAGQVPLAPLLSIPGDFPRGIRMALGQVALALGPREHFRYGAQHPVRRIGELRQAAVQRRRLGRGSAFPPSAPHALPSACRARPGRRWRDLLLSFVAWPSMNASTSPATVSAARWRPFSA